MLPKESYGPPSSPPQTTCANRRLDPRELVWGQENFSVVLTPETFSFSCPGKGAQREPSRVLGGQRERDWDHAPQEDATELQSSQVTAGQPIRV